ncbi:MAG: hypothetical protein ACJ757_10785 [Gaiellaceae bacterium]
MNCKMNGVGTVLLLALLCCLSTAASASTSEARNFSLAGGVISGRGGVALLRYDFTGEGVQTVRMYLAAPNKYRTLVKGTSKYSVLRANVVVHRTGGDVIIRAGTKHWTRTNPPRNYSPTGPHVFLAFKVARNIPHVEQCIRVNATGYTPPNGATPAYNGFTPAGGGYCMTGKQWLKWSSN